MPYILINQVAKGEKTVKLEVDPAKYGAHKSQNRNYNQPLWEAFEPNRDYRS
jgi:hypothetical protein